MSQENWKMENDETDSEILKLSPRTMSSSSLSLSFTVPLQEIATQRSGGLKSRKCEEDQNVKGSSLDTEGSSHPARSISRCSSCHKRVGLTGFRCRCGHVFCGKHRHSVTHDCTFDYKATARDQIAKANPVIRAAKIAKI